MRAGKLLVEQCRRYGFYEPYREELEFAFAKLYYVNTLFTYMIGVPYPQVRFLRELKQGILQEFPNFQNNCYFIDTYDREQKKLVRLHMKSDLLFLVYYKTLIGYRKLRQKWKESHKL